MNTNRISFATLVIALIFISLGAFGLAQAESDYPMMG